jgi:hypothetical protein
MGHIQTPESRPDLVAVIHPVSLESIDAKPDIGDVGDIRWRQGELFDGELVRPPDDRGAARRDGRP